MTEYISALMVCLQPINLLLIIAMVSLGIVFGAIPGLSATLGIALLLPVTFGLSTETSFVLLLAIWIGGVSGTFISAVLIGIPGSSSAIATCFDGFPMTKNGQAGKALGIGMTASFIGTVGSVALATVLSPVIAEFALHLGPWEYFSLCFCAITLVASLSKGNIFKGIMAAGIGLLMGCIGMDPINGSNRFTFGNIYLSSGISTVAQMLGMFAMCQIIRDSARGEAKMPEADMVDMKGLGVGIRDIVQNIKTIVFAFISGLWIGFLPGMGSGISNMVAYGYAKSISKDPESFGSWIYRTLTREAWRFCRKHRKEQPVEAVYGEEEPQSGSVLEEVMKRSRDQELYRAVRNLPVKQRTAVVLYYFNRMSTKEIAQIMGCLEGTVKSRLYTARENLKKELTKEQNTGREVTL